MSESQIKHLTSCKICGQQFQNWQMDIPIVGQPPSARVAQFVGALAGHLQKKHGDKMKAIATGGQEFMGMLIMMLFSTSDPNLIATIDHVRTSISILCRQESEIPSDSTIQDRVARAGLNPDQEKLVFAMMRELRDYCLKLGKFAPQLQQVQTV